MKLRFNLQADKLRALYRSDFARKVGETLSARLFLLVISFVSSVFVTRALGPENNGRFNAALVSSQLIIQCVNFGIHASNTYYVSQDRKLLPKLLGNSMLVSFGVGGILVLLSGLLFMIEPALAPVGGVLLALTLLSVPFGVGDVLLQGLLMGLYEIRKINVIQVFTKIINVVVLLLLILVTTLSPEAAFLGTLVRIVLSFLITYWLIKQQLPNAPEISLGFIQDNISYGLKAYLSGLFSFMVLQVDLLMVQYLRGFEELGYYSLAVSLINIIYLLPTVTGMILFPRLSNMTDPVARWKIARQTALLMLIIMLVVLVMLVPFVGVGIELLYGKVFLPAAPAFRWLLVGLVFMAVNTIFQNYFASIGNPMVAVISPLAAVIVNIGANLILTPEYGIVGAAISSVIAYGLMLLFSLVYIWQFHHERYLNTQDKDRV